MVRFLGIFNRPRYRFRNLVVEQLKGNEMSISAAVSDTANVEHSPFLAVLPKNSLEVEKIKLDQGVFYTAFEGKYLDRNVTVKTVKSGMTKRNTKCIILNLTTELKMMAYVGSHENLVHFHGAVVDDIQQRRVFVVFERSSDGPLDQYLQHLDYEATYIKKGCADEIANVRERQELEVGRLMSFAKQIASGMKHLESKTIVHGNLTAGNVQVFRDGTLLKIGDWTFSSNVYNHSSYGEIAAPVKHQWVAPETLGRGEYSSKSDAWSFGVTLWEVFSFGKVPFPDREPNSEFIAELRSGVRLTQPVLATEQVWEAMSQCWYFAPKDRPTFANLFDYFQDLSDEFAHASKTNRVSMRSDSTARDSQDSY